MDRDEGKSLAGSTVLTFGELAPEQQGSAGGKGGTLARLYQAGYPIPDGFVLLPAAFDDDRLAPGTWATVRDHLARLRVRDPDTAFAVRSSGHTEDSAEASFAGVFETVLSVSTDEAILEAVLAVRDSRRSERARVYGRTRGIAPIPEMAVVVQRLVPVTISGVLFTADPVTGSRAAMTGQLTRGFGDRLVAGEVTGEAFTLERPRRDYSGPAALERHAKRLYRLATRLERELGCPQDIEWAIADGKLWLLQSRPITTLVSYDPVEGTWNDTLTGDFLWSSVNFGEAVSAIMTPLTWTVIRLSLEGWMFVPGYPSSGNIGGRPYLNLSVMASIFHAMGKTTQTALEMVEPTLYTRLPKGMQVPLLPLSKRAILCHLPRWIRIRLALMKGVRDLQSYVTGNRAWCRRASVLVRAAATPPELLALWQREIKPHLIRGVWIVLGSASQFADFVAPLRRELIELVGADDADALLTAPRRDGTDLLANLGPLMGVAAVASGEMNVAEFLDRYGHRGPHEFELSLPRPAEDPAWLEQQVAQFRESPVDVEARLAERRRRFEEAWSRLRARYPRKARPTRRRLEEATARSHRREAARSEYVRDRWIVRRFAVRAGELTGLAGDIFFLTIEEVLDLLSGRTAVVSTVARRKESYRRYCALPPYPPVIRGRFDPFQWASDPERRSDFYDAQAPVAAPIPGGKASRLLQGAAGSAGRVEGLVRNLTSPTQANLLRPGEVLVTAQADIAWTPVFPRTAAIVTDIGAPLSHAAIVARELGIPAVVGCGEASRRLQTGERVLVDGGKGMVRVLGDS